MNFGKTYEKGISTTYWPQEDAFIVEYLRKHSLLDSSLSMLQVGQLTSSLNSFIRRELTALRPKRDEVSVRKRSKELIYAYGYGERL